MVINAKRKGTITTKKEEMIISYLLLLFEIDIFSLLICINKIKGNYILIIPTIAGLVVNNSNFKKCLQQSEL